MRPPCRASIEMSRPSSARPARARQWCQHSYDAAAAAARYPRRVDAVVRDAKIRKGQLPVQFLSSVERTFRTLPRSFSFTRARAT